MPASLAHEDVMRHAPSSPRARRLALLLIVLASGACGKVQNLDPAPRAQPPHSDEVALSVVPMRAPTLEGPIAEARLPASQPYARNRVWIGSWIDGEQRIIQSAGGQCQVLEESLRPRDAMTVAESSLLRIGLPSSAACDAMLVELVAPATNINGAAQWFTPTWIARDLGGDERWRYDSAPCVFEDDLRCATMFDTNGANGLVLWSDPTLEAVSCAGKRLWRLPGTTQGDIMARQPLATHAQVPGWVAVSWSELSLVHDGQIVAHRDAGNIEDLALMPDANGTPSVIAVTRAYPGPAAATRYDASLEEIWSLPLDGGSDLLDVIDFPGARHGIIATSFEGRVVVADDDGRANRYDLSNEAGDEWIIHAGRVDDQWLLLAWNVDGRETRLYRVTP